MDSDKNQNVLEKQLKTLGQKTRIDILKKLKNVHIPISFSKLKKEVLGPNLSSVNLSFHLNALKKCDLILSSEEGYSVSHLGGQIIDKVLSIEKILNKKSNSRMIRTSKYSKELFDINKIEDYLVNEGELDPFLAKQIAHEVEERLSTKTNIEYMTAPLMREYINAVLIENNLEEVRHKLTRLGTPPFEALKLFRSKEKDITPENFIQKLGSDVSEQFLLLNLIPKNLADLYLSGEISLLHLNYWSLRPLSIYLNTETVMELIFQKYSKISTNFEKNRDFINLFLNFVDILYPLRQFYSEDLILGNFNKYLLSIFDLHKTKPYIIKLLANQILRFNNPYINKKPQLSLDFNYSGERSKKDNYQYEIDIKFINQLIQETQNNKNHLLPLFLIDYSKFNEPKSRKDVINELISNHLKNNLIFYNGKNSELLNSSIIKILTPNENFIILDKILINLYMISVESNHNDALFLDLLQEKINSVFQIFGHKERLVKKKLGSLKEWKILSSQFFKENKGDLFKNALKSISFFGLNEAIMNHCGIELDRTENSEKFALKIISFMKKIIEVKNIEGNNNFILSQPHFDDYLKNSWHNGTVYCEQKTNYYSSRIIRKPSTLPMMEKIKFFKNFEKIINGGTLFSGDINGYTLEELQNILFKSDLNAFHLC